MRINPTYLGLASAIAAGIFWIVCSLLVFILPQMMMNMTGAMVHADLSGLNWKLSTTGILAGLISWSIFAGLFGWLMAYIYNLFAKEV